MGIYRVYLQCYNFPRLKKWEVIAMLIKSTPKNYRMDAISLAYLQAMQEKTSDSQTDLLRQAIAYYANYLLESDEIKNIQMELLFGNSFRKK